MERVVRGSLSHPSHDHTHAKGGRPQCQHHDVVLTLLDLLPPDPMLATLSQGLLEIGCSAGAPHIVYLHCL